jgi:hypothetical protein
MVTTTRPKFDSPLRACLGNGGFKWMEEDWRGFWEILTYNGNSSTPMPFIPLHSTNSQTIGRKKEKMMSNRSPIPSHIYSRAGAKKETSAAHICVSSVLPRSALLSFFPRADVGSCEGMYNPQTGGRLHNLELFIQTDIKTAHTTHRR